MPSIWEKERAIEISRSILAGQMSILEGVRALHPLAHNDAIADEADRKLIIAVQSETDDLPIGEVRTLWAPRALAEKDVEISRSEDLWREKILAMCRRIVEGGTVK